MAVDIRTMVPRVRRAIEGAGAPPVLTDDTVKDVVADALGALILYSSSAFGRTLDVTAVDLNGAPSEYSLSTALSLAEQTAVANQAALDYFFFQFAGLKVLETIGDEGSTWTYELSPLLLANQLKLLQAERDKALEALEVDLGGTLDTYISFLAVRDSETSRIIEPYLYRSDTSIDAQTAIGGSYGGFYGGYAEILP